MRFLRNVFIAAVVGLIVYNSVDDRMRAKFDNGFEEQLITLREIKNSSYIFCWEMLGAWKEEVIVQREVYDKDISGRRRKLQERREQAERVPAFVEDPHKFDKYLTK